MKSKVLSVEQMRELIGLGVDISKASMIWLPIMAIDKATNTPYVDRHDLSIKHSICNAYWKTREGKVTYPTFTLQDILEMLPPTIEWKGHTYWFAVYINGFGNKMIGYRDSEKWPLEYVNMNINGAYKLLKRIKTIYEQ